MKTKIFYDTYKDRPAIGIETETLKALFLHEDGGKFISLIRKDSGAELMEHAKGEKYLRLSPTGSFVDCECSAFDDMFPTIDPCAPAGGKLAGVEYPDHGEVCRLPHTLTAGTDSFTLSLRSPLFGYEYDKTVTADAAGGISINYRIKNATGVPFPCLWAGHCMLHGTEDARVYTSYPADAKRELMFGPEGYGLSDLPGDRLIGYTPVTGLAYKYYYVTPMPEGHFGVRYGDGKRLDFGVDPAVLPYVGVWLNNGSCKDMYNIALEVCSAPYDRPDRAAEKGYDCTLPLGQKLEFSIKINLL